VQRYKCREGEEEMGRQRDWEIEEMRDKIPKSGKKRMERPGSINPLSGGVRGGFLVNFATISKSIYNICE
jgi:hypothetical protein